MRSWRAALAATAVLGITVAYGQQIMSPRMNVAVAIDGKKIKVGYGAPSMRGRKIMGLLVPYNEVWCAGANDATSLDSDVDLDIAGLKVPKGSYTLWTLPNANEWKLIVSKQTGVWHTEYDAQHDLGRVKMDVTTLPAPVERLKFELASVGNNKARLSLRWETTEASVPITVLH